MNEKVDTVDTIVAAEQGHLKQNKVVSLAKLTPHPDNYRMHPEAQVSNLVASLARFGQGRSIVVQDGPQGYLIVAGHGIVQAAEKLGLSELRADILPADWTPEQVKGYLIADNQHVEQAEDDVGVLARLLQEQQDAGYDLATLGTDADALSQMLADLGDEILAGGPEADDEDEGGEGEDQPKKHVTLAERFIVPPFSVLDARQGYWQDRKRAWISLGIKSELGRGEFALDDPHGLTYGDAPQVTAEGLHYYRNRTREERVRKDGLLGFTPQIRDHYKTQNAPKQRSESIPRNGDAMVNHKGKYARTFRQDLMRGEYVVGTAGQAHEKAKHADGLLGKHFPTMHGYDDGPEGGSASQSGTSIFDPVLCELVYRWFTPAGGHILDPFAGGSVRGIVAAKLGRSYTGIDLRPEQVAANDDQWRAIAHLPAPVFSDPGEEARTDDPYLRLRAIAPQDFAVWRPYYEAFARTHTFPRHFQSPLHLLQGGKEFCWTIVEECLVIVKRRTMMGNRVLYLLLPPMHLEGNAAIEKRVLEEYRTHGLKAVLSEEDLGRYDYQPGRDADPDDDNAEFIYRAGDLVALEGSEWKHERQCSRKLTDALAGGSLTLYAHEPGRDGALPAQVRQACHAVTSTWRKQKREREATVGNVHAFLRHYDDLAHSVYPAVLQALTTGEGTPVAYTIGEQIGPAWAALTVRYHDYEQEAALFGDAARTLHLLDGRAWAERLGPDALLNLGAARKTRGPGMLLAKEKLHPTATIPLFKLTAHQPVSDEVWKATEPEGAERAAQPAVPSIPPRWITGDSRHLESLCPEVQADMLFTCPPYYDLEVYCDDPLDLSTAKTYEEFLEDYRRIMQQALTHLKDNRFACVVVGDIRSKKTGFYRNFVSDTIAVCQEVGALLYNEAILVTVAGSLPIRAGRQFSLGRKLGKTHQNVLIFCKGDPRLAMEACGPITVNVPEPDEEEEVDAAEQEEEETDA